MAIISFDSLLDFRLELATVLACGASESSLCVHLINGQIFVLFAFILYYIYFATRRDIKKIFNFSFFVRWIDDDIFSPLESECVFVRFFKLLPCLLVRLHYREKSLCTIFSLSHCILSCWWSSEWINNLEK